MTKKGIVKSVQANGTWEGKYGLMYLYEVTINEDSGQYMSKSDNQTKFIKGQEAFVSAFCFTISLWVSKPPEDALDGLKLPFSNVWAGFIFGYWPPVNSYSTSWPLMDAPSIH